jgi:hypothetical protein
MAEELEQFDDPNLKAALRRAAGALPNRPDVRARIAALVESETRAASDGNGAVAPPLRIAPAAPRRLHPMRWLAAAAVLLIAVGSGFFLYQRHHEAEERAEYLQANNILLKDMIKAQQGAAGEVKPITVALTDRDAVQKSLSQTLGRNVLVPQWPNWQLTAAGIGAIAGNQAAELTYKNGPQQILFVSLPAKAFTGGDEDDKYQYQLSGHPIAGFIKGDSLNCVIGDSSVKLDTAAQLADSLSKS